MTQQTTLPERPLALTPEQNLAVAGCDQFASPRVRLDRLSTVRSGTVAVELTGHQQPVLRRPGELLLPAWTPWGAGVHVIVVATEPVQVRVAVDQVLTLDGQTVALVELDLVVRLSEEDVGGLVAEHDTGLDAWLGAEVRGAVDSAVRAAVGLSRAQDLRGSGLAPVLGEQWLPAVLAGGALVVESFALVRLRWSEVEVGSPNTSVGLGSFDDEETQPLQRAVLPARSPDPSRPGPVRTGVEPGRPPYAEQGGGPERTPRSERATDSDPAADAVVAPRLRLAPLGREDRHQASRSGNHALGLVHLPAVISVAVWWIFFIAYWLPELQTLPGATFLLEQLAPLASKELSSQGEVLVIGQGGHSGAPAAILLVASLLIAPLARSRYWLARLVLWPVTYVATVAATVAVLGVLLRGRLMEDLLGVTLVVVWVYAAAVTTWHSLWVDIDTLPRRPDDVAWILGLFALIGPAPVALGRAVFAPELRLAAIGVLGNDAALRWAALLTPATAWVYLSGVLLGVLVWAGYLLWPPRRMRRVLVPVSALLCALLLLALVSPQATRAATRQAEAMRTQSPGTELSFTCGVWTRESGDQPVQTLVVRGLGCRQLTSFRGYVEVAHREAALSLSPVRAETFSGARVDGRLVAAQYGDVVVLAATDRLDRRPTALIGFRLADAAELWRVPCPADGSAPGRSRQSEHAKVRFARASGGDDPAAGRQTGPRERASVVLDCGGGVLRVDPGTGRVSRG